MVLAIALLYFVILSLIVGFIAKRKIKSASDFTKTSEGLGWVVLTFGFALIPLGAGNTLSLWESAPVLGASVAWWGLVAGAIFMPVMMLWFGPWVRQTGLGTMPEIFASIFGKEYGRFNAAVNIMMWTGIGAAETAATATAIYGLSDGAIPFIPHCVLIALALIIAYVFLGGMLQLVWLNVINAFVMIIGSFLGMFMLGGWLLANAGGWEGIKAVYEVAGTSNMLQQFNFGSSDLWFQIIIPVVVLHMSACGVAQNMNSPFFAAKSDEDCRKGIFIGPIFNTLSVVPWIVMALCAVVIPVIMTVLPEAEAFKLAPIQLAITALPKPIIAVLMISLLAATLSTGGATILANANILANDVLKGFTRNLSDKGKIRLIKGCVLICAAFFAFPALSNAVIFPVFLWCFSFGIPIFVVYFLGLKVKRSSKAAWITIVAAYIVNFWWTFATPSWATGPWALNMYPVTVVSVILGIVLTLVLPGGKPPLLRKKARLELEQSVVQ